MQRRENNSILTVDDKGEDHRRIHVSHQQFFFISELRYRKVGRAELETL